MSARAVGAEDFNINRYIHVLFSLLRMHFKASAPGRRF